MSQPPDREQPLYAWIITINREPTDNVSNQLNTLSLTTVDATLTTLSLIA